MGFLVICVDDVVCDILEPAARPPGRFFDFFVPMPVAHKSALLGSFAANNPLQNYARPAILVELNL